VRGRKLAIALGVGFALSCATAQAATVSVFNPGGKGSYFVYEAGPGERNRLVAGAVGQDMTVTDPGATIEPGVGCVSITPHRARCDFDGTPRGPGDLAEGLDAELRGGADTARLDGGLHWQSVHGGPGPDVLHGGPLFDRLDGGVGADRIFGGKSEDGVDYFGRKDDLKINLGDHKRNDGGPRDGRRRDLIRGVEDVGGGLGNDLIVGTNGPNRLAGREGRDRMRGRGGVDTLEGGDDNDKLRGGGGGDHVQGNQGDDREFGGAGADDFGSGISINGADLVVGGGQPGDWMSYAYQARIEIDGKPNDGACADPTCAASQEGDEIRGVRTLTTFTDDDLIIGSRAAETIRPSSGADVVRAKGGDDTIDLGLGDGPDIVNCGGGIDTVLDAEGEDELANCEL
jgi:Ca2+-binding RTX toxin-like protein